MPQGLWMATSPSSPGKDAGLGAEGWLRYPLPAPRNETRITLVGTLPPINMEPDRQVLEEPFSF